MSDHCPYLLKLLTVMSLLEVVDRAQQDEVDVGVLHVDH